MVENSAAVILKRLVSTNIMKILDSQAHHICIEFTELDRQKKGERSKLLALFYPSDTAGLLGLGIYCRSK